jgi:hypothetical protein
MPRIHAVRSLAAVALLAAAACGTTTQVVATNRSPRPLAPRSPGEVDVYTTSPPARPFVEVAIIQARQSSQYSADTMPEIINAMRQQAAQVGCDGVVIHGASNKVVPTGWGEHGTSSTSLDGYWGACIVYTVEVFAPEPVAAMPAPAAAPPAAPAAAPPAAPAVAADGPTAQQTDGEEPPTSVP